MFAHSAIATVILYQIWEPRLMGSTLMAECHVGGHLNYIDYEYTKPIEQSLC